jgi:alkanesulfonate monooxygenase SsuD/methylene tetrahydromethanopterin reductase-like flavin-dependent oxidoreductase (luciferase family)
VPYLSIAYDLRHPPFGPSGRDLYAAALDQIAWADDVGFAVVGFGEHHQSPDGYIPAPLVAAAAVGGRTRQVRVRCSVILAPLYDPVRLAEEIAVADLCLGGRLQVVLGAGYVEADFTMFGKRLADRGRAMEDIVPFLRQAFTGEPFEYRGQTVRVTPRPAQDPFPIWIGASAPAAVERAARLADGFRPPMPAVWERYRRACTAVGRDDPGPFPPQGPVFLWVTRDDPDRVWERLTPHILHQIGSYASWTTPAMGRASGPFVPTGDVADVRQGGSYRVVTPEEAIALAEELGPDGELRLNPLLSGIDPAWSWEMLHVFEDEVLPHLTPSPAPVPSPGPPLPA